MVQQMDGILIQKVKILYQGNIKEKNMYERKIKRNHLYINLDTFISQNVLISYFSFSIFCVQ